VSKTSGTIPSERYALAILLLVVPWSRLLFATDAFPDSIFANEFEVCSGLQCAQVSCPSPGATTSVSGTVFAPNGTLPLPNVEVYVPNASVGSLTTGVGNDRCEVAALGHPLVATLSDDNGNFTLKNVPVTTNMPLVIITGKWRRQILVSSTSSCIDMALTADQTRLPRDHTEGDIPHLAITTGGSESLECLIRKTGVADTEFTTNTGSGRINLYAGHNGTARFDSANGGTSFASATTLWSSSSALVSYDQVMFACEGDQETIEKPQPSLDALKGYADAGGRVYLSHWQNYWLQAETTWNTVAQWNNGLSDLNNVSAQINDAFGEGSTFKAWLSNVGASSTSGELPLSQTKQTLIALDESLASKWIYLSTTANGSPSVQYLTFTTPLESSPSSRLGRVLFTEMHALLDKSSTNLAFPSGGCTSASTTLLPSDRALLYATFDLQRCVDSSSQ
jgi:hypothetical protein